MTIEKAISELTEGISLLSQVLQNLADAPAAAPPATSSPAQEKAKDEPTLAALEDTSPTRGLPYSVFKREFLLELCQSKGIDVPDRTKEPTIIGWLEAEDLKSPEKTTLEEAPEEEASSLEAGAPEETLEDPDPFGLGIESPPVESCTIEDLIKAGQGLLTLDKENGAKHIRAELDKFKAGTLRDLKEDERPEVLASLKKYIEKVK